MDRKHLYHSRAPPSKGGGGRAPLVPGPRRRGWSGIKVFVIYVFFLAWAGVLQRVQRWSETDHEEQLHRRETAFLAENSLLSPSIQNSNAPPAAAAVHKIITTSQIAPTYQKRLQNLSNRTASSVLTKQKSAKSQSTTGKKGDGAKWADLNDDQQKVKAKGSKKKTNLDQKKLMQSSQRKKKKGSKGKTQTPPAFPKPSASLDFSKELVSPAIWNYLVQQVGVTSVLDWQCGTGISSLWFLTRNVKCLCLQRNRTAVYGHPLVHASRTQYLNLQAASIDSSWIPTGPIDIIWGVTLEHDLVPKWDRYVAIFRDSAMVILTVKRSEAEALQSRFQLAGFELHKLLTLQLRRMALTEQDPHNMAANFSLPNATQPKVSRDFPNLTPHSRKLISLYNSILSHDLQVYINPKLVSDAKHKHLKLSGNETILDSSNLLHISRKADAMNQTKEMNRIWEYRIRTRVMDDRPFTFLHPALYQFHLPPSFVKEYASQHELTVRLQSNNMTDDLPVQTVVAWPYVEVGIQTAEHLHLQANGMAESAYLKEGSHVFDFGTPPMDNNVVWVADTGLPDAYHDFCDALLNALQQARAALAMQGLPLTWPVFIVDFTDFPILQYCRDVVKYMGEEFVHYSKRSLAERRKWKSNLQWVVEGERANLQLSANRSYRHTPLTVRTDTVVAVEEALRERNLTLADSIEEIVDRPVDVSHFWPLKKMKRVSTESSRLRQRVSHIVATLGEAPYHLNVFVDLKGEAVRTGRRGVMKEYALGLLESKIIVVTQRDRWEDHYRLFEAFMGGAMVMTDRMIGLPAGLQNGTSVIEFNSAESLVSLILYYLYHPQERIAVAKAGRKVAMSRHRTWHRLEEIIFGQPMTVCTSNSPLRRCPYIVHGNQSDTR